jgi:hypothetical protein
MLRHVPCVAILVACLAVPLAGAERATFVLTDGSRQSGLIAFHGTGNRNIIDNYANLAEAGAPDKTIPLGQIAIIDFAGSDPAVSEFEQLPGDDSHLLVLRGGGMQRGRLQNLVNGDTVQWQNEAGQPQQYAIRDVARIFLNSEASRRLFPSQAAAASASAVSTAAAASNEGEEQAVARGAVRVSANQPWVSTGLRVSKGQRVKFASNGQVHFSPDGAHVSGPDGNPSVPVTNLPVATMAVGGLIGRVGDSAPFAIGSNQSAIQMPASGLLMLGVNDTNVGDNSGFFAVTPSRGR